MARQNISSGGARWEAIRKILWARQFMVFTDSTLITMASDRFIEEDVPLIYERATDISLKYKAQRSKAKIKFEKPVAKIVKEMK